MTHISSSRTRITAALVAAAVGATTFTAGTGTIAASVPSDAPAPVLSERMNGEAAIRALGNRLPEVARTNGLATSELARRLRSDDQLWVGESGMVLFVDETLAHADTAPTTPTDPSWTSHQPAEAFALHSRPGASRVVYLDFDGHSTPGGGWSGKAGAPYDTDGRPTSFSDAERRTIIDVWRHVAEDYAPFAIDVTTADPGVEAIRRSTTSDAVYGTRVVVTPTMTDCTSCGGIAYVGTYDAVGTSHDHYQPAWVYSSGSNPKSIAEAVSHEAGHNLGLSHDGTTTVGYYQGHGDWAPIMGVGYYEPVTQWSRGEYAGANNTEDDFAVVAANGGVPAADDHGGTASTATALPSAIDVTGDIGSRTDVDAFSFTTAGGVLALQAAPVAVGANLDLALRLVRQDGTVAAIAEPAGLAAGLDLTLPGGTYTLLVDGVGTGDPRTTGYSDYGSVGRYRLTGQLPTTTVTATPNQAPVAYLSASTTSGTAPLPVRFDGSRSHDPDVADVLTHTWAISDGTSLSGAVVEHTFTAAGTYRVTLTVSDGKATSTASTTITVAAPTTTKTTSKGSSKPAKTR